MLAKCFLLIDTDKPLKKVGDGVFEPIMKRTDTGEEMTWGEAPVGAMMFFDTGTYGPDGKSLIVKIPGGDWHVDGQAMNCDSPCGICGVPYKDHKDKGHNYEDSKPDHRCWIRHGEPPNITVDKNGNTCGAGAGSILVKEYHGFLRNGELTDDPNTTIKIGDINP